MPGKNETSRNGSKILKTTTWGSVIALSAAILVAGLTGLNPLSQPGDFGHPAAQVAEKALAPAGHSVTPAQEETFIGGATGQVQTVKSKYFSPATAAPVFS